MRTYHYSLTLVFCALCYMQSFAASFSVSGNAGVRDTTMILTFNGTGTHFTAPYNQVVLNYTTGQFVSATVISIDSLWATSNTKMYVKVTVSALADITSYRVYLQNSTDGLMLASNYLVVSGADLSNGFSIPKRGNSVMITLTTINGNFTNDTIRDIRIYHDTTLVNTITIDSLSFLSATVLKCRLSIAIDTKVRSYKILVNSKNNGIMKTGFTMVPGYLQVPDPSLGFVKLMQGKSWVIDAEAVNALVSTGAPNTGLAYQYNSLTGVDSLDNSVVIDSCVALSDTQMRIYLHIGMTATPGFYTLRFWNKYDEGIPLAIIIIQYYPPTIAEIYPKEFLRGQQLEATVYGSATNFNKGVNTVKFWKNSEVSTQVVVDSIVALDSTLLKMYLSIDSMALAGTYTVEVSDSFDEVSAFYDVKVLKGIVQTDPLFYRVLAGEQGVFDLKSVGQEGTLFTRSPDATIRIFLDSSLAGRKDELTVDSFLTIDDHKLRVWVTPPKTSRGNFYLVQYYSSLDDTLTANSFLEVFSPFITDTSILLPRGDSVTLSFKGAFTDFHRTDSIRFGYYDSWTSQVYLIDSGLTCTSFEVLSNSVITLHISASKNIDYYNYYVFVRDTVYGYLHSDAPNITIPRPEIKSILPNAIWRTPQQQTISIETKYLPDLNENITGINFVDTAKLKVNGYSVDSTGSIKLNVSINKDATPAGGYPLIVTLKDSSTMSINLTILKAAMIDFYPKQFEITNQVFTFVLKGASKQGLFIHIDKGTPGNPLLNIDSISYAKEDTIIMVGRDTLGLLSQYLFFISNNMDNTIGQDYIRASVIDDVNEVQVQSKEIFFANPAYGDLVFTNKGNASIKQISIIDLQGKEVYTKSFNKTNQGNLTIEKNTIPGLQGMYFLKFEMENSQLFYSKILIEK